MLTNVQTAHAARISDAYKTARSFSHETAQRLLTQKETSVFYGTGAQNPTAHAADEVPLEEAWLTKPCCSRGVPLLTKNGLCHL